MSKFIIPFNYLFFSRLKTKAEAYSLICIYPLFLGFFIFGIYRVHFSESASLYLILLMMWMSIYEIGYLVNDSITVHREKYPNFRISLYDIKYIKINFAKILIGRVIIFAWLCGIVLATDKLSMPNLLLNILYVGLGGFVFFLHNSIRSRWNIATYLLLCILKYIYPMVFLLGWDYGIEPYVIIILSFPILRSMEHSAKPKYNFKSWINFIGCLDRCRVYYYGLGLVGVWSSHLLLGLNEEWVYAFLFFFIFRLSIVLLIRMRVYSRTT